jgi:hypothetical protein
MGICNILVVFTLFFHIIGGHGGTKQINSSWKAAGRDENHWLTNLIHATGHVSRRHKATTTMGKEGSLSTPCDCRRSLLNDLRGGHQADQDILAEVGSWSTSSLPETVSNGEHGGVKAESSNAHEQSSGGKEVSEDDMRMSSTRVVAVSVINNSEMSTDNNKYTRTLR